MDLLDLYYVLALLGFSSGMYAIAFGLSLLLTVGCYKLRILDIFYSFILVLPFSIAILLFLSKNFLFSPIVDFSRSIVGFDNVPLLWINIGFFLMIVAAVISFKVKRKKAK